MILDHLKNYGKYNFGKKWDAAFDFILSCRPDTEEKRYEIDGADIYALVVSYMTKTPDEAKLESHIDYIDIQVSIAGKETLLWYNAADLDVTVPYNKDNDIIFYKKPEIIYNSTVLQPGIFSALFPQDGHMTGVMTAKVPDKIKKVIIKMRTSLLKGFIS